MKANIPNSAVVPGHRYFEELVSIRDELLDRAGGLKKILDEIPALLREEIDIVIDTPRTGRRSINDLEKTEKSYIGTRVEILVRSYFRLTKGKLDLLILGKDADVKFTTLSNWMIPKEAVGKPCLLLAADEAKSKCYFGLFVADGDYLTAGANQDKKRQISAMGFEHIMWIFCHHQMKRNFWDTISEKSAEAIASHRTGNGRVESLFCEVLNRPISREVVEATARQKDFMRRLRADNGRGTRDRLLKRGILLLSGTYDAKAISALGLGQIGKGEFISWRVKTEPQRQLALKLGYKAPKKPVAQKKQQ